MAFHSYTRLIQKLFNAYWFGPPFRVTGTSSWPSVDHLVSRLPPPTKYALFRLAFTAARVLNTLTSPVMVTRRFIMQKARRHRKIPAPTACRRKVSGTISLFFSKCFSPFPHGTGTLSVSQEYLALPDGPGGFTQDFSCPALLRIPLSRLSLRIRGCHPLRPHFPECSARNRRATARSYYPRDASLHHGFGLFPVRSPLLGESLLFSLPPGTKMFQFPGLAS